MTREEEIFQEAKSRFIGEDHEMYQVRAFEAGAHWADSHPYVTLIKKLKYD